MYCPKCAAQNGEDARFCRVCGSNLSLIPQALTGQLPAPQVVEYDRRGRRRAPSFERGVTTIFMGMGFAIVALALVMLTRNWWGVFMLIPAFSMLGSGVSMVLAHKNQLRAAQAPFISGEQPALRRPRTGELIAPPAASQAEPPSVTEGTTRILDHSAEAREQNR